MLLWTFSVNVFTNNNMIYLACIPSLAPLGVGTPSSQCFDFEKVALRVWRADQKKRSSTVATLQGPSFVAHGGSELERGKSRTSHYLKDASLVPLRREFTRLYHQYHSAYIGSSGLPERRKLSIFDVLKTNLKHEMVFDRLCRHIHMHFSYCS